MASSGIPPLDAGIDALAAMLHSGELTATALADAMLTRIDDRNGGAPSFDGAPEAINAWVHVAPDTTLRHAADADRRLATGDRSPLCGIPIAVKDLFAVAGEPVTASSRVLDATPAARDSAAWAALAEAGAVYAGHTHTHEFAAGGTTDQVGNPWNLAHSPGGSSGGSAAAVAAGMVPVALGTDTAGSLRIPAAMCGVSSFKPTYGRVALNGVIPLATTLDHAGPIARTLADCAAVLPALSSARAARDPWGVFGRLTRAAGRSRSESPGGSDGEGPVKGMPQARLAGVRIAITPRVDRVDLDPDVRDGYERMRDLLADLGAEIVELPAPDDLTSAEYDTILVAEARAFHARYRDRADRYRPSVRAFVDPGAAPLPVDAYLRAQARRCEVTAGWDAWFRTHRVDALLEPTTAVTAPLRGHGYDADKPAGGTDPYTTFTATWNVTGMPVAALPAGLGARSGLPVGVSLIAPHDADERLLTLGIALQDAAPPPAWRPALLGSSDG
ncbi:amidase [Microbacterium sp.]|uniref:amidase n=1 Tax=Microbacterium sp. TaxID=51671 RepID=UPI003A8CA147